MITSGLPFQNLPNKTGIQDKNRSKYRKIQDRICKKTGKVTKIQDVFAVFLKWIEQFTLKRKYFIYYGEQ